MLFKRFSRSRSNSRSYVDDYNHSPVDSKTNSASYDDPASAGGGAPLNTTSSDYHRSSYDDRKDLPSSRHSNTASQQFIAPTGQETSVDNMYPRTSQDGGAGYRSNGHGYGGGAVSDGYDTASQPPPQSKGQSVAAPDLIMQAFNQALRPHLDRVDQLEAEIADLRAYVDQLEQQRGDVHAWIDKRGLRPDVPPSIAAQMDAASHANSPTHAAATLNAQLDRKITIVNFDLHRLQDDLNDSLPTPSFSACMLKFLPDIHRLAALPSGPRYAFDLLLKLGGNLNSHGGLENGDEEDLAERRSFYAKLDEAMVEVVRGRFREEGDGWGVQREMKRIEKTGAYLRNWGVEPYFPLTLDVMRQESGGAPQSSAGGAQVVGGAQGPAEVY